MRWRGRRKISNVEDRRAIHGSGSRGVKRWHVKFAAHGLQINRCQGYAITSVVCGCIRFFSGNLGGLLTILGKQQNAPVGRSATPFHESFEEKEMVEFVSVILADTEDTWTAYFQKKGRSYEAPRLVLFRDAVESACGMGQSAMGPFYCPGDQQVYIDLGFYNQLRNRFKAPGDFAQAYVIAHEVGHHIQKLLGISAKVHKARKNLGEVEANKLSVRQELQADCLCNTFKN